MRAARDRGIALVSVLWIGFLLTIIAASIAQTIRVQIQTAHNAQSGAVAQNLADGAIVLAALDLPELRRDPSWQANGSEKLYEMRGGRVTVTFWDEGGKIDLNRASDELLRSLFVANGASEDEAAALVDAIADWKDKDDLTRLNGAEDPDYRRAGLKYGAKDGRFDHVAELRRVLGMTAELYRQVAPALTVHSGQSGIDLDVAPPEVLRVLAGIGEEAVMSPSQPKEDEADRARRLRELIGDRRLITRSRRLAFTVRAVAETSDGAVFVREAILRGLSSGEYYLNVLDWSQGRLKPVSPPEFPEPAVE